MDEVDFANEVLFELCERKEGVKSETETGQRGRVKSR